VSEGGSDAKSENMQSVADTSDGISTRQRSFLGRCMAMPTNRRFPPPWSIEDTGAAFGVTEPSALLAGFNRTYLSGDHRPILSIIGQ